MSSIQSFTYIFEYPDGKSKSFELKFDQETFEAVEVDIEGAPEWTDLKVHQCDHCPLDPAQHKKCPLAANLHRLVGDTDDLFSYDEVNIKVISGDRTYMIKTNAQRGISSMMGLMIPGCGCPYTAYFRPMARFHLPFSDTFETIYRTTSMFLLAQYFKNKKGQGGTLDVGGLKDIYGNVQKVNKFICERLREVCKKDSSLNAVVLLDMFSLVLPMSIENSLAEIESLFKVYLDDAESK